ncbi:Ubiquitin-like domain-containing protein [Drosera capensis]
MVALKTSGISIGMAEQSFTDGASASYGTATTSDATVELNIKTLDSRIFTFRVEKTIPVLSFKEKIAGDIGVPVGQQRLIFRGKVLKDEHLLLDYHVENGDTLHLVERQPTQPQSASGTNSGETNARNDGHGNDGVAGPPRNRFGQIAHSVLLRSFNVGEQGDGAVPDVNLVIGAVLNSLGIGNLAGPGSGVASQNAAPPSQGSEAGAAPGDAGTQMGGQTWSGQHQPSQFPPSGPSIPLPTFHTPIPDSLRTISDFINRMEGMFSANGYQTNQSSHEPADQPAAELPSNPGGFPTPEALSIVLRRTQQLVTGGAATMLSHIAGRLEQEAGSTDPSVRSQIQNECVQLGLVMQHLGALFLELGRTILTLRMGLSPVESGINAGPAVYISSSDPNPIMAQPFPLQTSPLFNSTGSSSTMGTMGPIGIIGAVPRHVNIHIHAGALPVPLGPAIGASPRTADGTQTVRNGLSGSSGSGPRASATRNGVPGPIPAPPVAGAAQPVSGVSTTLPADYDPASLVADCNMHVEALVRQQAASASAAPSTTSGLRQGTDVTIDRSTNESAASPADSVLPNASTEAAQAQKDQSDSQQRDTEAPLSGSSMRSAVEASLYNEVDGKREKSIEDASVPSENRDHNSDRPTGIPLGLGLGGLQPKRSKTKPKSDSGATSTVIQGQPAGTTPGQVLQPDNRTETNYSAARQPQPGNTQLDLSGMMSQFIQSPALNGIFSGLAAQAGGSPDDLRNMFHSLTQNPAAMSTVSQLAQQLTRDDDIQPMLAGLGGGQGGGLDLSRMVQEMMPIVSQALGGNSGDDEMIPALGLGSEPSNISGRRRETDRSLNQSSQYDFQQAIQDIMMISSPQDLFGAVVQHAAHLYRNGIHDEELVYDLVDNDALANEFVEVFDRDLLDRLQGGSRSAENS